MENIEKSQTAEAEVIDGIRYRKVPTGYTVREYFSHHTTEKGPGPGWDSRWEMLKKYGVDDPSELPNDQYYIWEEVEEDDKG